MNSPKPLDAQGRAERVKRLAREAGFDLVGIAPPVVPEGFQRYERAVASGFTADMQWLKRNRELRSDVRLIHPSARAVIALAVNYCSDSPGYIDQPPGPNEGWIARYAQGKDYHVYVRKLLVRLVKAFEADPDLDVTSFENRIFVDTGPVLEKSFAQRAGIGWIGKNSLLLNRDLGSWVFLAVILTPLDLAFDQPATDHCGSCTRCLDVCPTDAFPEPFVLDARRCIATWTIESDSPSRDIEPTQLGQHVFGCDLCQDVCPWNRKTSESVHGPLLPRPENVRPSLDGLEGLSQDAFKARFPKSAVRRTDAKRMSETIAVIRSRNSRNGEKG